MMVLLMNTGEFDTSLVILLRKHSEILYSESSLNECRGPPSPFSVVILISEYRSSKRAPLFELLCF